MNLRMLERLEMIAASRRAQLLDEIKRQHATLAQITHQREVLGAYRNRLLGTWRDGGIVTAGQAQRAGNFVAASDHAGAQIDQTEKLAATSLSAALDELAKIDAQRRGLAEARQRLENEAERAATQKDEREQPFRAGAINRHVGPG